MSRAHKKEIVQATVKEGVCSGRAGCRILELFRSGLWYRAGRLSSRLQEAMTRIHALTKENLWRGYRRIAALLRQEG